MGSEASAIDVSVSAPLAREDRGAILSDFNPRGRKERVRAPYAASVNLPVARKSPLVA